MRVRAVLLALILAAPARAETVTIPFAPPEGIDLRYRSERVIVRLQPGQNAIETRIANTATFRFARGPADGWTLTVTPGIDEVTGNAPEQALAIARTVATASPPLPMEVRLDRAGNFLDLANADQLMSTTRAAFDRLRASQPEGVPPGVVEAAAASVTGLTRAAFVEQAFGTFRFAFESAAEAIAPKTSAEVTERLPVATSGGVEAEFQTTVSATRLTAGSIRVTASGTVDLARLAPDLEAFTLRLLESQPGWRAATRAEKAKVQAQLADQFRNTAYSVETLLDLDLATGLPLAATEVRAIRAPSPSGTFERRDTVALTRLP